MSFTPFMISKLVQMEKITRWMEHNNVDYSERAVVDTLVSTGMPPEKNCRLADLCITQLPAVWAPIFQADIDIRLIRVVSLFLQPTMFNISQHEKLNMPQHGAQLAFPPTDRHCLWFMDNPFLYRDTRSKYPRTVNKHETRVRIYKAVSTFFSKRGKEENGRLVMHKVPLARLVMARTPLVNPNLHSKLVQVTEYEKVLVYNRLRKIEAVMAGTAFHRKDRECFDRLANVDNSTTTVRDMHNIFLDMCEKFVY